MKKRHSIHLLLAAAALLLATAACTKDELADGDRLPEGQYPVEIARITLGVEGGEAQPWGAPQTRVGETGDGTGSVFSAGDRFAVQIDGEGEVGTYTVRDDGSVEAETPLYWSDRDEAHTVSAWYPATDGTLDLGDQSQSLAYLLYGTGSGNYQTPVTLTFAHQLAKVRVTPTGDALGEVQSLQLYTYTQCTYEKGKVVQGTDEGWIEMKKCEYTENGNAITCWEANVVPGYTITKLMANNDNKERDLSAAITPEAGKFYNITLDKDKGYTEVSEGNYTVNNEKGLKNLAELVNNGETDINITLNTDLNLTNMEWTPIGTESQPYTGTFDGNNYTITGLTVNQTRNYVGLIGCIGSDGTVKNVKLENVNITGDGYFVGGVAGTNYGTIENCSVDGTLTNYVQYLGGVVGDNYGSIIGCSSSGTITGTGPNVGGIGGQSVGGTIMACYSVANIKGRSSSGGVLGQTNRETVVIACYHAKGNVTGEQSRIGGVIGWNYGKVTACYWENNQEQGIGDNQAGTGETTKVTDGDWLDAVAQMNAALSGSGWQYEIGVEGLPVFN